MKIYTKTGDKGETSLVGGHRSPKNCSRLNAYGTIDELNTVIGIALEEIRSLKLENEGDKEAKKLVERLLWIQSCLFTAGGMLATEEEKVTQYWSASPLEEWTKRVEQFIDEYTNALPALKNFILPSGSKSCAMLHWTRTTCRRAEREICQFLSEIEDKNGVYFPILQYVNRLSDFFFIASRIILQIENVPEKYWESIK
ncbi:MAG: cob(I)yrinic acid a,c-diamide adenosyltransferase [Bacteroidales bacterium]|nr:cob(I)yrinic acid a,c-diamide adenosyltransferase [Bacteroidales bacterium]